MWVGVPVRSSCCACWLLRARGLEGDRILLPIDWIGRDWRLRRSHISRVHTKRRWIDLPRPPMGCISYDILTDISALYIFTLYRNGVEVTKGCWQLGRTKRSDFSRSSRPASTARANHSDDMSRKIKRPRWRLRSRYFWRSATSIFFSLFAVRSLGYFNF